MGDIVAYYPPETRAMPLTLIRRERMLPVPGKVLVSAGEKVQPTQVVAQAEISGEVRIVNVARLLRLPASRAVRFIKVKEGDDVTTHTVIAARGWLPSGRVTSPTDGFVYRVDKAHGRILIKVVTKPFQLTAYLGGVVTNVMSGRGVVIETTGTLLQATVGFGDESFGVLHVVAHDPADVLRAKSIDVTAHGAIVVGGAWIDEAALQQAAQLQVRGIIAGSMDGRLIDPARRLPFPVLLTEGLGRIPMSRPMFKLLSSQTGREASISALTRTRWGVQRPEILIPLPADSKPALPTPLGTPLTMGVRVRVIRGSVQGATGTVVGIPDRAAQTDSGARVHGAEIEIESVGKMFVPFANLEILRG
jgi:hypothetical protein